MVGDRRSIREAAAIVGDLADARVEVSDGRWEAAQAMDLDGAAAAEGLSYEPEIFLEEGLRRTMAAMEGT